MVGWGWGGHVLTFMWTCRWSTCYALAAGRCMYSWVGWGVVGHVLTFMWTCRWRTCYAVAAGRCMYSWIITSMTLFFIGHATLLYVHLSFVLMGHATVLYVLLNFALMGHAILLYGTVCSLELCTHGSCYTAIWYCMFSWTLHSWVMLRTPPWHNMRSCGAGAQAYRVHILKGSWKNWRRCSDNKTVKNMWRRISFRLARKPKHGSFV